MKHAHIRIYSANAETNRRLDARVGLGSVGDLRATSRRRRGNTYLMILGVVTLLTVTALAGVSVLRANRAAISLDGDVAQARVLAKSAMQMGVQMAVDDIDGWRATLGDGAWLDGVRVDQESTVSLFASDETDGDIADDRFDEVTLTAVGRVNSAVQSIEAVLEIDVGGYETMAASVFSDDEMEIETDSIDVESFLGSNDEVEEHGEDIDEFGEIRIDGSGDAVHVGPMSLEMPPPEIALDELEAIGTRMSVESFPGYQIKNTVLTEKSNQFGPVNPRGVYIIDCANKKFVIRDSLIRGTIVLINPGGGSEMRNNMHWEPLYPTDPALVVFGDHEFQLSDSDVVTASITGAYIHPDDEDWVDAHDDSTLTGFIYVDGDLKIKDHFRLVGAVVVGGEVRLEGDVVIENGPNYAESEVVGFRRANGLRFKRGAWRRVVR